MNLGAYPGCRQPVPAQACGDGPMTRRIFESYVETQRAPTLSKGEAVILDKVFAVWVYRDSAILQCVVV